MRRHLVAVDIGGSKTAILAREAGSDREVHSDKLATPVRGGVGAMLRVLDDQIEQLPGGRSSVAALGVAVPGCVDPDGRVVCAGNLDGWVDVPLRAQLEERYRVPVFVEGDANCGALGEKWLGAAKDLDDFVFLALGTGVGAGLFVNGAIHRGAHFAAGEVGEMTFPCDERGKHATRASDVLGKRAIKKMVRRATGEKLTAAEALERAATKRRLARATKPVIAYLSASVAAISALLDPEAILFGGGTSKAGDAFLARVREAIPPQLVVRARLMLAGLGPKAQLYGALWGAQQAASASRRRAGIVQPVHAAP
ncbi:MAG: ROK family protein [Myxococcales bacterium]